MDVVDHRREIEWPRWTAAVTALVPAVVALDILRRQGATWPPGWTVLVVGITLAPWLIDIATEALGLQRSLPEWLFAAIVLGGTAYLLFEQHPTRHVDLSPFFLVVLTAEMAARLSPRLTGGPRTWMASAIALASMLVVIVASVFGAFNEALVWVMGIGFAWLGGALIGYATSVATDLKAAEADLAEKVVAEERSRIAREVHDVIAHSLSVTMLHVTAARMALERGSQRAPEALEALREAEQQGRKSLGDIRRTVGLLGAGEGTAEAPMPTVSDLPKLVVDFRAAGLDVTLSMDGDVAELPAPTGLNLYRIVQESLTNVAKHAPGASARVELYVDDDIRLRVHNTATNGSSATPGPGGGLGMLGMIERATALGGTLAADEGDDGWTVFLYAPLPASEPATD